MDIKIDKSIVDNKVINEMIMTEKTYNQALGRLQQAFSIKANVQQDPLLLQFKEITSIFKNISDALLAHVEKAVDLTISEEEHSTYRTQRTQLLKAFFQAYRPYVLLFDQYLAESSANKTRFESVNAFLIENSNMLDLGAHLIQPVQRGPRYSMLVTTTKKINEHLTEINTAELETLENMIAENLFTINDDLPQPNTDAYWFGKITYTLLFGDSHQPNTAPAIPAIVNEPQKPPYKFGDFTRSLIWGNPKPETKPQLANFSTQNSLPNIDTTDLEDGFYLIENTENKKNKEGSNTSEFTL